MSSNQSIEFLYNSIKAKFGKVQAKTTVKAMIGNILDDLESEGIEVSEKNVAERLKIYELDLIEMTKRSS